MGVKKGGLHVSKERGDIKKGEDEKRKGAGGVLIHLFAPRIVDTEIEPVIIKYYSSSQ